MARFGTGPLIAEIVERMNATVAGVPGTPKFVLLSGHDNGPILNFLAAFGAGDGKWPPFGALIALELYEMESGGHHAVRLVYNGQVLTSRIEGCCAVHGDQLCPWPAFREAAASLVPTASECAPLTPPSSPSSSTHKHGEPPPSPQEPLPPPPLPPRTGGLTREEAVEQGRRPLIVAIALLATLLAGLVLMIILCRCRNHWRPAADLQRPLLTADRL